MAGNFFVVSAAMVEQIAAQTQWAEAILAYLVLAKHRQSESSVTTAGAPAIAKYLGITRHKAEKLLHALRQVNRSADYKSRAVVDVDEWNALSGEQVPASIKGYPAKILPSTSGRGIVLPNVLVEGVGKGKMMPPLSRICNVYPRSQRLDSTNLLLKLYQQNSYADYGGIDPKILRATWCHEGQVGHKDTIPLGYQGGENCVSEGRLHFWIVTPSKKIEADSKFIWEIAGGDAERFWKALGHLRDSYFLLEVAMVFDEDPLSCQKAEVLYPLYVFDRHTRDKAEKDGNGMGGLAREGFNCLDRSGLMDDSDFRMAAYKDVAFGDSSSTGFYVFVAPTDKAALVSVYRLRYQPSDHDLGIGFKQEQSKTAFWKHRLDNAFK